jgi:hypothetical protein
LKGYGKKKKSAKNGEKVNCQKRGILQIAIIGGASHF